MGYFGAFTAGDIGGMAGGSEPGVSGAAGAGSGGMDYMGMLSKMFGGGQKQQQQPQGGGDQYDIPAQKPSPNDMFNKMVSNYTYGIVKFGKDAGGGQARTAPKLPPPQIGYPPEVMMQSGGGQTDALSRLLQVYSGGMG